MKKAAFLLLVVLLFLGCRKDPLTGITKILEGKWRWSHSVEYKENLTTQNIFSIDTIPAISFNDTYEIEFLSKGCVHYLKNDEIVKKYRIVFAYFKQSTACPLNNCNISSIYLNDKNDKELVCFVNADTLMAHPSMMPIVKYTDDNVFTYYSHYFIKVN